MPRILHGAWPDVPLVGASSRTSEVVVQSLVSILDVVQLLSGCVSLGHLPLSLAAVEWTSLAELGGSANGSKQALSGSRLTTASRQMQRL